MKILSLSLFLMSLFSTPAFADDQSNSKEFDDDAVWKLKDAVWDGDYEKVKSFIEKGVVLNTRYGYYKISLLFVALRKNNYKMAELLLKNGADPNIKNKDGDSVWHKALVGKEYKWVELFLKYGADLNIKDKDGNTYLHTALVRKKYKRAEFLLKNGADPNIKNKDGDSVWHKALVGKEYKWVELFLQYGADVNARYGKLQLTSFYYISFSNDYTDDDYLKTAELLLKYGADVNFRNAHGNTALHVATRSKYPKRVKFLIQNGADVNAQNKDGNTSLHEATAQTDFESIKLLLENGADPRIRNNNRISNIRIAERGKKQFSSSEQEEIKDLLKKSLESKKTNPFKSFIDGIKEKLSK